MIDVTYFRDYRHNYLIIRDSGCLSKNVYQWKMITENKIKGLLACQERYINGDILLYYDISSRQSLSGIYEGRTIGMAQLRRLFIQLKAVNDTLQTYLLDGSSLILLPEYIFQNLETEEYLFLYYPEPEVGKLSELMEFLTAKVDSEDMEAVETVYKMTELIQREQFVLDEILRWFQDDVGRDEDRGNYEEVCQEYGKDDYISCGQKEDPEERGKIFRFLSWLFCRRRNKVGSGIRSEKNGGTEKYIETCEDGAPDLAGDMGNTIFLPWTEVCENKLYSIDRRNKSHIDLARLPLTVGKLAGAVDMVISEASISRMHARFSRNGNKIYITDLNSTNGTFRNGMRLAPNASEPIEPGDEIRLGKLKFIYR